MILCSLQYVQTIFFREKYQPLREKISGTDKNGSIRVAILTEREFSNRATSMLAKIDKVSSNYRFIDVSWRKAVMSFDFDIIHIDMTIRHE